MRIAVACQVACSLKIRIEYMALIDLVHSVDCSVECQCYMGFWTPLKGTIYAALRIKAQLVAKPDQRLGTDYLGNAININQANQTLVRIRERDFHDVLDSRGLRWDRERKNELFVPGKKE